MAVSTKEVRVADALGKSSSATGRAWNDAVVFDIQTTRDAILFLAQKLDIDHVDVANASTNYEDTVSFLSENVAQRTKR